MSIISIMGMAETLRIIENRLRAGMTDFMRTDENDNEIRAENQSYYVKTWFRYDPLQWDYKWIPFGVIMPTGEHRLDQYVQEDTEIDALTIYLYTSQIKTARGGAVIKPTTDMVAMVDRATLVLRDEPTYTHLPSFLAGTGVELEEMVDGESEQRFTSRNIINAQVLGSQFNQVGFVGGSPAYKAEIRYQVWRRVEWFGQVV